MTAWASTAPGTPRATSTGSPPGSSGNWPAATPTRGCSPPERIWRFPTTTGAERSAPTRALHRYLDRVVTAATRDPQVADAYVHVLGMLARPSALFAPHVVATAARTRPQPDVVAGSATVPRPRSPLAAETGEAVR